MLASRSAEDQLFDLITDDEVKQALEDLPENFRLPVLLADVEGFSYKEIAEMLDIPIGTVMSRLHRGRKAMQKALYDYAHARGLAGTTTDRTDDDRMSTTERTMDRLQRDTRELETFLDDELSPTTAGVDPSPTSRAASTATRRSTSTAELKAVIAAKCRNDEPPGSARAHRALLPGRPRRRRPDRLTCAWRGHARRRAGRHARRRDLALVDRRHPPVVGVACSP